MTNFKSKMMMLTVLSAFAATPALAAEGIVEIQRQNNISYVTGGVGDEETHAIEAMQSNYNFRVMSADRTGHFFGDTRVVVSDKNNEPVLDMYGGPLFLANLPAGTYKVEAMAGNQTKTQNVTVGSGKTARLHFAWLPDNPVYSMNQ